MSSAQFSKGPDYARIVPFAPLNMNLRRSKQTLKLSILWEERAASSTAFHTKLIEKTAKTKQKTAPKTSTIDLVPEKLGKVIYIKFNVL